MLRLSIAGFRARSKHLFAIRCLLMCVPTAWAADVRVYTDGAHPIAAPATVSVVHLDEPMHLQAELSQGLPKNPANASQLVQERLRAHAGQLNQRLSAAYQGVVEAWSLGILKLPAVVVDGRFVVYGDADVTHALSLIQHYRGVQP